jgi:hypothetical protein
MTCGGILIFFHLHQGVNMKSKWLKILNPILGLAFIFQIAVGFFSNFILIKNFELIHKLGAGILSVCVMGHVYLNWQWIKANYFKK